MARRRNITNEALSVPALGVIVEPGAVVQVPDELCDPARYVWPEQTWEDPDASSAPVEEGGR
ncbi:hypothetical protein [Frankia sp. Cj3]|uniref:hypothetical protein n=1 Tax=Frankia sp. Cj3 TaxID=2880976 RepID=UPI001EF5FD32|nr:hypothetical protein [Frankia sp. Cj3]